MDKKERILNVELIISFDSCEIIIEEWNINPSDVVIMSVIEGSEIKILPETNKELNVLKYHIWCKPDDKRYAIELLGSRLLGDLAVFKSNIDKLIEARPNIKFFRKGLRR